MLLIIGIISAIIINWFSRATAGILCSFVGLLGAVTIRFALNVHWDWPHLALAGAALAALVFNDVTKAPDTKSLIPRAEIDYDPGY